MQVSSGTPLVQAMDPKNQMPTDRSPEQIRFWATEQLCGHSDGLDQFQTSGPAKTPYAEWTDWLPMDPYEALGHEKRLALEHTSMDVLWGQFPETGPLHRREFADSWNLDHVVCHKLCSLPVGLWPSKFDCRRSEQYCGRNLKIPPHLRQRVYVAGGLADGL